MSRLFVYYSNSGNGDYVASIMREKGFNTLKIELEHELPQSFFFKIIVGGFKSMIKEKPKIKNDLTILKNYNEIYVGTPIWNKRVSAPINTVLESLKTTNFNLICYSGSGNIKKIVKEVKDYKIENIISLIEPLKNKEDTIKILNKYI